MIRDCAGPRSREAGCYDFKISFLGQINSATMYIPINIKKYKTGKIRVIKIETRSSGI
jgi:hypothetical protein